MKENVFVGAMKTAALLCTSLFFLGCASEQEIARRDAEELRRDTIERQRDLADERRRDAEDRRRDAEDRQREGERAARNYADYREGFARALGKTVSQLTPAERARMDREYYGR